MNNFKKKIAVISAFALLLIAISGTALFVSADTSSGDSTQKTVSSSTNTSQELINLDSIWRYLDDNTDPAGSGERTSWTAVNFDDSAWKTNTGAEAKFGAKRGAISDLGNGTTPTVLLNHYIDGSTAPVIPTYFFRMAFELDTALQDSVLKFAIKYDDAAIIYINGQKVRSFYEPSGGYATNMSYGGSNIDVPLEATFTVDASYLQAGKNVISVEIHNGTSTSSDVYFEMSSVKIMTKESLDTKTTISLGVGVDETQRNITWHSTSDVAGKVQYAEKDGEDFPSEYFETEAKSTAAQNNSEYYINRATLVDLKPNTEYVYRLVNVTTSEMYSFKTSDKEDFSFLFAGDPQIGAGGVAVDQERWNTVITKAVNEFPDSTFLVTAGDQVNIDDSEEEYKAYMAPDVMTSLTNATVIGNHDNDSVAYSEHFNNPNTSIDGVCYGTTLAGVNYWYVYNNILFLNLNTNNLGIAGHKEFLEKAVAANPDVDWKVVVFHQCIYSAGDYFSAPSITGLREGLVPVFTDLDIDVVLTGHNHVYTRTYMMNGLTPDSAKGVQSKVVNPAGILYITANSSSGSKYYYLSSTIPTEHIAVKWQGFAPSIANVEVSATSFRITTYNMNDMSIIDTFEIVKSAAHTHSLTHVPGKKATCTEEGNIEYWYCNDCQTKFSDADALNELTTSVTVDKTAHVAGETVIVEATNEKAGSETVRCENCGGVMSTKEIPKKTDTTTEQTPEDTSSTDVSQTGNAGEKAPQTGAGIMLALCMSIMLFSAATVVSLRIKRRTKK